MLSNIKQIIKNSIYIFDNAYKTFFIVFIIYFLISFVNRNPWETSDLPYFNYLADAFLHGQLNFRMTPPSTHDLVIFNSKLYAYWPPFPALLLMPFIALFGIN